MTIYDITLPISSASLVWPGDPPAQVKTSRAGDFTVTRLAISAHTGTHLDAPAHIIAGGLTVEALDLETLVGPALVVEAPEAEALTAEVLESLTIPPGVTRLLFHTRNSAHWATGEAAFDTNFVALTPDGARWLVAHGVRLVGIDYLSIASWDSLVETHRVLLGAGVIAVEGLNLTGIEPGVYQLICLPLKLAGSDGAPVRAVLVQ